MMPSKEATPDFPQKIALWRRHNVAIYVHDLKNNILSNFIVDMVMWTKFSNSSISMGEVFIHNFSFVRTFDYFGSS